MPSIAAAEALLDEPAERAVRAIALRLLDDAADARDRLAGRARTRSDPEALHDFRVALRRLRSWLRAYRSMLRDGVPRGAARRLRATVNATGASRDAEVRLAWLREQRRSLSARQRVGLAWLVARTLERKRAGDDELAGVLRDDFTRARRRLARTLGVYKTTVDVARDDGHEPPAALTFAEATASLVDAHAAELRARLDAVRSRADDEPAHAARIAAKRLRYLLEPLAAARVSGAPQVVDALEALQDALGDVHDVHVFSAELAAATDGARKSDPRPGLEALGRRLRARAARAWAGVERDWLGAERGAAFFRGVDAVARALERRAGAGREIEHKFLLARLPDAASAAVVMEVEQGYLPGERLVERVRRVRAAGGRERYYRTVKVGSGASRLELEEEATPAVFRALWPLTKGRRVRKRRYEMDGGSSGAGGGGGASVAWVVDEFLDRPLVLAEVELDSARAEVRRPEWLEAVLVREVTEEDEFTNARLAR